MPNQTLELAHARMQAATEKKGKVLQFPVREEMTRLVVTHGTPQQPMVFAVYHCAGHCGALVSAPACLCLACAAEDRC